MTTIQEIRARAGTCHLDADGIFRVIYNQGEIETLADAHEIMQAMNTLSGGRPCPVFVDMRYMQSQHRDARQYYGSPEVAAVVPALALLVESRISQLIANFFISGTLLTWVSLVHIHRSGSHAEPRQAVLLIQVVEVTGTMRASSASA